MTEQFNSSTEFNRDNKPIYIFKVVLLGQERVGKTCIAKRLCFDTFDVNTKETLGIEFYTYELPIVVNGEGTFVRISIWDFGGREQFKKLFPYYINGANGIFMVFNVIDLQTLLRLDWWYERLGEYNHGNTPRMFIGAQNDLVNKIDEKARVDDLVIDRFMSRHAEVDFFRTSSKENCNIKEVFKELVIKILDKNKLDYDKIE
ncbi:MAG: GTP-binding protein [Candidatus Lokiarchaeota archaeon]|nr:GTP-binding protein [Candidatus Lokiarchaeota archaeon]